MPEVTIGSMMNNKRNITVSGFRNIFTITTIFINRYHVTHYGIFERYHHVLIAQGRSVMGAVNNMLIFLEDKEQEDLDLFIKVSK